MAHAVSRSLTTRIPTRRRRRAAPRVFPNELPCRSEWSADPMKESRRVAGAAVFRRPGTQGLRPIHPLRPAEIIFKGTQRRDETNPLALWRTPREFDGARRFPERSFHALANRNGALSVRSFTSRSPWERAVFAASAPYLCRTRSCGLHLRSVERDGRTSTKPVVRTHGVHANHVRPWERARTRSRVVFPNGPTPRRNEPTGSPANLGRV